MDLLTELPKLGGDFSDMDYDDWVDYFIYGQCHALAMSLSNITGYDIYIFSNNVEDDYLDGYTHSLCHAFVLTPSGDVFDIRGITNFDEAWGDWGDVYGLSEVFQVTSCDFDHWNEEPDFSVAEPIASWLVKNFC